MATASGKGYAIAAPQIFTSDPLEQNYAKGTLDPDMGGLAWMYMNAARGRREDNQREYMQSLGEANRMSAALARNAEHQDTLREYIKSAAEMANAGIDPSTMIGTDMIYKNPGDELTRSPSFLSRDKKASEAAKNRAEAANAGAAHGPSYTVQQTLNADGTPGSVVITGKGPDPRAVQGTVQGMTTAPQAGQTTPTNPNASIRPDGTVGPTSIPDARARASAANQAGQQQRAAEAKARAEAQRTQQRLANQPGG